MHYRAYFLDEDGHICQFVALECADDVDAKRQAEQLLDGRDIEVWQHARNIAILKARYRR